ASSLFIGVAGASLGLCFQLAFLRHETDQTIRTWTLAIIRWIGALFALAGLGVGLILALFDKPFLVPYGCVLALLGLVYLWGYIMVNGADSDTGYRTGLAVGFGGAVTFLIAFCAWAVNQFFYTVGWSETKWNFLIPQGLLIMGLGLLYAGV